MKRNVTIVKGTFSGADIEPGTFHLCTSIPDADDGSPGQRRVEAALPPEANDPAEILDDALLETFC